MTRRATVERDTGGAPDEYGMRPPPTWATHIASLPCWDWTTVTVGPGEREVEDARKTAIVEDVRAIVPKGTDITERDRINTIKDRRGNVVRTGTWNITSVVNRRDHLALALVQVT